MLIRDKEKHYIINSEQVDFFEFIPLLHRVDYGYRISCYTKDTMLILGDFETIEETKAKYEELLDALLSKKELFEF